MKNSSTYRILYILNLLNKKDHTKSEIVEEFSKIGEKVSKPSINLYINKLVKNGVNIKTLNKKGQTLYHLLNPKTYLNIDDSELNSLNDIKKIVIAQKDYNKIRKFIRILYKFIFNIKDKAKAQKFFDFGYYSKINWGLVLKLQEHCLNKDLIEIDYVLASKENRKITLYAHDIKISEWSDRFYLWGKFENSNQISYLPVDRIYMINKVIKNPETSSSDSRTITYAVSKDFYKEIELEEQEKIIKTTDKYVFIQRKLNDEFYLIQRLMSFCPNLYYISDEKIKKTVLEKLSEMKLLYEREYD